MFQLDSEYFSFGMNFLKQLNLPFSQRNVEEEEFLVACRRSLPTGSPRTACDNVLQIGETVFQDTIQELTFSSVHRASFETVKMRILTAFGLNGREEAQHFTLYYSRGESIEGTPIWFRFTSASKCSTVFARATEFVFTITPPDG